MYSEWIMNTLGWRHLWSICLVARKMIACRSLHWLRKPVTACHSSRCHSRSWSGNPKQTAKNEWIIKLNETIVVSAYFMTQNYVRCKNRGVTSTNRIIAHCQRFRLCRWLPGGKRSKQNRQHSIAYHSCGLSLECIQRAAQCSIHELNGWSQTELFSNHHIHANANKFLLCLFDEQRWARSRARASI